MTIVWEKTLAGTSSRRSAREGKEKEGLPRKNDLNVQELRRCLDRRKVTHLRGARPFKGEE